MSGKLQGRVALGPHSGRPIERRGRPTRETPRSEPGRLCAAQDGFSLHAEVRVESHARQRLEHLCRCVLRPPIATERFSLSDDGKVVSRSARYKGCARTRSGSGTLRQGVVDANCCRGKDCALQGRIKRLTADRAIAAPFPLHRSMNPVRQTARATARLGAALLALASVGAAQIGPPIGPQVGPPAGPEDEPLTPAGRTSKRDPSAAEPTSWTYWWEIHGAELVGASSNAPLPREQVVERVVPALVAAIEEPDAWESATMSLLALARIGRDDRGPGMPDLEAIVGAELASWVQEVSETAAIALGLLGSDASVPTLIELLLDDECGRERVDGTNVSLRTRAFAAHGLALIGARTTSEEVRRTILVSLCDVLRTERSPSPDVRTACVLGIGLVPLARVRPEGEEGDAPAPTESRLGQIELLLGLLATERDELVRAHVPTALAALAASLPDDARATLKPRVARSLLAALDQEEDRQLARGSALALGRIADDDGDPIDVEIRRALMRAAQRHPDVQTKAFARVALADAGGRPGGGEGAGADEAAGHLAATLSAGDPVQKPWAALALGLLARARLDAGATVPAVIAPALREALGDADALDEIGACSIALGLSRDLESRDALLERLDSVEDSNTRGHVALGLGLMGARDARGAIREALEEPGYDLRILEHAGLALALLGDTEPSPDWIALLLEARGLRSLEAFAVTIGRLRAPGASEPLIAALHEATLYEGLRAYAAVALGILADRDGGRSWHAPLSRALNYRASPSTLYDNTGTGILNWP